MSSPLASAATRELTEGRASVLAIEGEAGIGKTRLVQRIVDDARSRGAAVFSGQAHPFERTRPFGLVSAALGLSRRSPDPRRAAIAALLAGEDAAGPAVAAGDVQYRVVEEIVDLVETVVCRAPGAAGGRGSPLGGQREPAGDPVGGAPAVARAGARRRDNPAFAAAGRGDPVPRRCGGRQARAPCDSTR